MSPEVPGWPVQRDESEQPFAHRREPWNLMISMLAAFRVGAFGNDCGRPQNGTASTGKLNHSNVRRGRASNASCELRFQVATGQVEADV
jgi:hypothetical protein